MPPNPIPRSATNTLPPFLDTLRHALSRRQYISSNTDDSLQDSAPITASHFIYTGNNYSNNTSSTGNSSAVIAAIVIIVVIVVILIFYAFYVYSKRSQGLARRRALQASSARKPWQVPNGEEALGPAPAYAAAVDAPRTMELAYLGGGTVGSRRNGEV